VILETVLKAWSERVREKEELEQSRNYSQGRVLHNSI
jgi:hypothetical protein